MRSVGFTWAPSIEDRAKQRCQCLPPPRGMFLSPSSSIFGLQFQREIHIFLLSALCLFPSWWSGFLGGHERAAVPTCSSLSFSEPSGFALLLH